MILEVCQEKKNQNNQVFLRLVEALRTLAFESGNSTNQLFVKFKAVFLAGALLMVTNSTHAVAVTEAKFSAPEIKRGIWPFMVMAGLFRLMPKRQGLDFIMRGNAIDAETAQEYGLINKVVKAEDLDSMVDGIANELASLAPTTMRQGLAAYNAQDDLNFDEAIPFLKDELAKCLKGEDAKEGITAFLEKRPPNWK